MTKARIKLRCSECGIGISQEQKDYYGIFACGHTICGACLPSRTYLSGPCTSCAAEMMKNQPAAASARRTKRLQDLKE